MNIKAEFVIILLLLTGACSGQNTVTDSSATVSGYWQKGDIANFILTQTKERFENKKLLMKGSSTSEVEVKVLFANKKSYLFNWRYMNIKVPGDKSQDNALQEFATLTEGINFMYQVSEAGEFQELVNWAEVQAAVIKIIDNLLLKNTNASLTPTLQQARKVFSTKESIEQLIMKDIQTFHALYGGEYFLNQKMGAETELPNFLGGNPFPANVDVELYELNSKDNTCKIRVLQTIDKVKAADEINAWMKKNGQSNNNNKNPIDIIDKTEYSFELDHGWVLGYMHTRSVEVNGLKNVETQELKRK